MLVESATGLRCCIFFSLLPLSFPPSLSTALPSLPPSLPPSHSLPLSLPPFLLHSLFPSLSPCTTGLGREMIVVVEDISGDSPSISGEALSEREVQDLNRGRAFVRHYLESGNSVLELSVDSAVQTTAKVITHTHTHTHTHTNSNHAVPFLVQDWGMQCRVHMHGDPTTNMWPNSSRLSPPFIILA